MSSVGLSLRTHLEPVWTGVMRIIMSQSIRISKISWLSSGLSQVLQLLLSFRTESAPTGVHRDLSPTQSICPPSVVVSWLSILGRLAIFRFDSCVAGCGYSGVCKFVHFSGTRCKSREIFANSSLTACPPRRGVEFSDGIRRSTSRRSDNVPLDLLQQPVGPVNTKIICEQDEPPPPEIRVTMCGRGRLRSGRPGLFTVERHTTPQVGRLRCCMLFYRLLFRSGSFKDSGQASSAVSHGGSLPSTSIVVPQVTSVVVKLIPEPMLKLLQPHFNHACPHPQQLSFALWCIHCPGFGH